MISLSQCENTWMVVEVDIYGYSVCNRKWEMDITLIFSTMMKIHAFLRYQSWEGFANCAHQNSSIFPMVYHLIFVISASNRLKKWRIWKVNILCLGRWSCKCVLVLLWWQDLARCFLVLEVGANMQMTHDALRGCRCFHKQIEEIQLVHCKVFYYCRGMSSCSSGVLMRCWCFDNKLCRSN